MTTQNLTLTRGASGTATFASLTSITEDEVLFRADDSEGVGLLVKTSKSLCGSIDEVAVTAGVGYVVSLTAVELDLLPNAATYKLYIVTNGIYNLLYEGSITIAGAISQSYNMPAPAISFDNGHNLRGIEIDDNIVINDDIIIGNSQAKNITFILPSAIGIRGKVYAIINTATANTIIVQNFTAVSLITLAGGEHCALLSDGANWIKFN